MKRLQNKVVVISGGASGQGAAETILFINEGAKVIIGDIQDEKGKLLEEKVRASGGEAKYVHLDVTNESEWQNAISKAVERYSQIDVLINNAGITAHNNIEETTLKEWETINSVNSTGVFLGCKSVIPIMKKAGKGSIVNISSIFGSISKEKRS